MEINFLPRKPRKNLESCVATLSVQIVTDGREWRISRMIYELQFRRYALPFRAPVRTAHGRWEVREGVIVRLESREGQVGFGEAAPVPEFTTETADEAESVLQDMGRHVTAERLLVLPPKMSCLRNAISAALRAVSTVVNPDGPEAAADTTSYRSVSALLPAGRAGLLAIEPKAEIGFRTFKWKVGVGDLADELSMLDDLCGALPSGGKLRLDANGAWERRQAERWLERCADRPVEFVEQPIAPTARNSTDLLLGLADDYPTPLALDESIVGGAEIERWLGLGWRGVFVIKPLLLSDVTKTIAQLEKARATVVFSSALETSIGARIALEIAFAWRSETHALGFGVWPLFADSRFDGPAVAPFIRRSDVARLDSEAIWTALN